MPHLSHLKWTSFSKIGYSAHSQHQVSLKCLTFGHPKSPVTFENAGHSSCLFFLMCAAHFQLWLRKGQTTNIDISLLLSLLRLWKKQAERTETDYKDSDQIPSIVKDVSNSPLACTLCIHLRLCKVKDVVLLSLCTGINNYTMCGEKEKVKPD